MPPAKKSGGKVQRITAALVVARVGGQDLQFRDGDILPDGVSEESLKHLESLGYVEEVDAPESDEK